jgi:hypothetical protein
MKETKPMCKWKLEKDMKKLNDDRASWARTALVAFGNTTGQNIEDEAEVMLYDLIIDLAHWCDRNDVSLADQLDHAKRLYAAETENQGEQFQDVFIN